MTRALSRRRALAALAAVATPTLASGRDHDPPGPNNDLDTKPYG